MISMQNLMCKTQKARLIIPSWSNKESNGNLKEYREKYGNKDVGKKHKGIQKDTAGMYFEDYSRKILSLHDHEAINNKRTELRKIKKDCGWKMGKWTWHD